MLETHHNKQDVSAPKPELCVVKFPEIILVLESGSGRTTMPILYLDSFFEVSVTNWSSAVSFVFYGSFYRKISFYGLCEVSNE